MVPLWPPYHHSHSYRLLNSAGGGAGEVAGWNKEGAKMNNNLPRQGNAHITLQFYRTVNLSTIMKYLSIWINCIKSYDNNIVFNMMNVLDNTICRGSQQKIDFLTWPALNIDMNKIDILRVTYHYSRNQVIMVINNWLWRHQQNKNWASETLGRCVKIIIFIIIDGFLMSCKK